MCWINFTCSSLPFSLHPLTYQQGGNKNYALLHPGVKLGAVKSLALLACCFLEQFIRYLTVSVQTRTQPLFQPLFYWTIISWSLVSEILHSFLLGHIQYKPICNTAYMCGRFTHAAFKEDSHPGMGLWLGVQGKLHVGRGLDFEMDCPPLPHNRWLLLFASVSKFYLILWRKSHCILEPKRVKNLVKK